MVRPLKSLSEVALKDSASIIKKLTSLGYRLTPQRAIIVSAIEKSEDHISAEEIYAQIVAKYPQVNISTVYRTLDLLKGLGLIIETDLGGGRFSYHTADRGKHHHLICQECGAMIDLDESLLVSLKETLRRQYGFNADLKHLAILGRCLSCRK